MYNNIFFYKLYCTTYRRIDQFIQLIADKFIAYILAIACN